MITMSEKKSAWWKNRTVLEIGVFFLLSLLPLFWLKPQEVVMGHDSGFRINFLSYYKSLLYAWNPVFNFGSDWQLYKGFLTTQLPEYLFTVLSGSWIIGQRIVMVYWFFVMQVSMYMLAKTIRPQKEHWIFRVSVSIFYAFNFFILQAWFIVERAKFSLYAAIPLSILLFYRVFIQKKNIYTNTVLFGMLYFFMSGGGSPPLYGATLIVWAVTYFFFSFLAWKERKMQGILFSLKIGICFGLAFLLLNAFWIVPQIGLYLSTYTAAVAERGGIENFLAWERVNSLNASILNLLRLQGIPDWYDNPDHAYAAAFLRNPLLTVLSFIPFLTILIGVLVTWVKKQKLNAVLYLTGILLCIGLFFAGGSHRPFGIVYEYAMRHVPGFAIFRSSFYKFGPLVWFSILFLSMYFIDSFLLMVKKRKVIHTVLGTGLIIGILLYHYPFFTANFFQFHREFSTKVEIPSYITDMATYINSQTEPNARIMVLPELTTSFNNVRMDAYTWNFFSLDILPRNTLDRSIIANDYHALDAVNGLYSEFMDGLKDKFLKLASYTGVRYILWRDDAKYNDAVVKGRTLPLQKEKIALYSDNMVREVGKWRLYDFGQGSEIPLIWTPNDMLITGHALYHPLDLLLTRESPQSAVIQGTMLPEDVIEADCKYCELDVYDKMVRETPQPVLRYQPGSIFFGRLVTSDKKAIEKAGNDPEALFNAYISHSQFQLALVASAKKPTGFDLDNTLKDIQTSFEIAQKQADLLTGRQKNVYATRLLLYIDVSKKFLSGISSLSDEEKTETLSFFENLRTSVYPFVWMSENPEDIRYEFDIPIEDLYSIVITNTYTPVQSVEIDGIRYGANQSIRIPEGYHTARIIQPSTSRGFAPQLFLKKHSSSSFVSQPTITFTKKDPTRYEVNVVNAQKPFMIILNEAFDSRWKAKISSERKDVEEQNHGIANGFANAWYMEKIGDYTVELYYQPQQYFYIGMTITCLSLLSICIFLVKKMFNL